MAASSSAIASPRAGMAMRRLGPYQCARAESSLEGPGFPNLDLVDRLSLLFNVFLTPANPHRVTRRERGHTHQALSLVSVRARWCRDASQEDDRSDEGSIHAGSQQKSRHIPRRSGACSVFPWQHPMPFGLSVSHFNLEPKACDPRTFRTGFPRARSALRYMPIRKCHKTFTAPHFLFQKYGVI